MPHTPDILPPGAYAVVSCHVERPLDDAVWTRFSQLQDARPGGFRIAALMRPPDAAAGEDEERWLVRAREAANRGPVGLHTHWTAPDHARPSGGDPAGLVQQQIEWLRSNGSPASPLFCGGGWYMDEGVAAVLADHGYADCTATAFRPTYLPPRAARVHADEPAYLELADGRRVLELPTTHSLGMLARSVLLPFRRPLVHAYFHDTDLLDDRRRGALRVALFLLGRRRQRTDLEAFQCGFVPAKTMSFAKSRG
jgi:hypothetical protein